MSRKPTLRDLVRRPGELGCVPPRSRGSHEHWVIPRGQTLTIVLRTSSADVSREVRTSVERALRREGLSLYVSPDHAAEWAGVPR